MIHFVGLRLERCDFLDNVTIAVYYVTNLEAEKIFSSETGGNAEDKEEIVAERVLVVVVFDELDVGEIADGISGSGFAFTLCCVVGRGGGVATIDVYDVG